MCQALYQEIKIDGEPDGLSAFEEPQSSGRERCLNESS